MIKNGEFCVYNGNEYELNEDNDGNLIIITTNREIIDANERWKMSIDLKKRWKMTKTSKKCLKIRLKTNCSMCSFHKVVSVWPKDCIMSSRG
mgnify:CR=1 FL=1